MKFKLTNLLLLCTLLSPLSFASPSYVDIRNPNIHGKVVEVSAPNAIKVKTATADGDKHFWVKLIHVDFGSKAGAECNNNWFDRLFNPSDSEKNEESCEMLEDMLDGKSVSVEVTQWPQRTSKEYASLEQDNGFLGGSQLPQTILKGYVFLKQDGKHININHYLIENGIFPVDFKQSRDATLVRLQKQARCNRLGIWEEKKGDPVEDLKCQGLAK